MLLGVAVAACSGADQVPSQSQVGLAVQGAIGAIKEYDNFHVNVLTAECEKAGKDAAWCPVCFVASPAIADGGDDFIIATFRAEKFTRRGSVWGYENVHHGEQKERLPDTSESSKTAAREFCEVRFGALKQ
ncbi:MAG: hypothetical protein RIC52_10820 [Amphiplicatus sp.]